MTSFDVGIIVGKKEFSLFSITPMTADQASDIDAEMAELDKKLIQNPENLYEVFAIHKRLFEKYPKIDVELDNPVHDGVRFDIQTDGYVGAYFRRPPKNNGART
jgi:hypothetical protein